MPQYSLLQLAGFLNSRLDRDTPITGVAVDSRLIKPGELFFALPGNKADGHSFIADVAARGAAAAVVKRPFSMPKATIPLLSVDDPLSALQICAQKLLKNRKSRIIAVTGSLGKTTTKDFIASLLKTKYKAASSPGNSNSQIGLPLAVLNHTQGDEDVLVLEMGMTAPGQIKNLIHIAPPEIAVITTTALVHAENFDSLEAIGRAKAEILTHPSTALGILDRGIVNFHELLRYGSCPKISFGWEDRDADYSRYVLENNGISFDAFRLPGEHNLHNFLAASAAAHRFGMEWSEIADAIPFLTLPERRLQMVEKCGVLFVNDAYNAAESSVKAALHVLPKPQPGCKRVAVLGGMVELGKFSEKCHQEVAEYAQRHVDAMLWYGPEWEPVCRRWTEEGKSVSHYLDREDLLRALRGILTPGDVVLLKGSRNKHLCTILEEL